MKYTELGRTGLRVSRAGLGAGGHSRIGQAYGAAAAQSLDVVRTALDSGITLIDTSELYGTESLIGEALSEVPRASVYLSTKAAVHLEERRKTAAELRRSLEDSLRRLKTEYVDIYHLHALLEEDYDHAVEELVPELQRMKREGRIRFIGVTERFAKDPGHRMLSRAVQDTCWDVIMVGFNLLNPSAWDRVLAPAEARGIGTLNMFAVRRALVSRDRMEAVLRLLAEHGRIDPDWHRPGHPLTRLLDSGRYPSLTELGYRYCAGAPLDCILVGTGQPVHLTQNLMDLEKGPLPKEDQELLRRVFAGVDSVSGD